MFIHRRLRIQCISIDVRIPSARAPGPHFCASTAAGDTCICRAKIAALRCKLTGAFIASRALERKSASNLGPVATTTTCARVARMRTVSRFVDDVIDLDANAVDRPDNDDNDVFWDEVDCDVLANFFGEHLVIASEEAGVADNIDASASAVIDNEPLRLPPLPPAGASINGATVNVRQSASDRRSIFVRSLHAADVAFGVNTEKGKKAFRRAFAMYDECMNQSFASRAYVATSEALPTPREKSISDEFVRLCEVEWRAKTGCSSYHFKLNEVPSKPARSTKSKAKQPEIDCNPVDQLQLRSSSASTGVGQAEMEFTVNDGAGQLRPENAPGLDIDEWRRLGRLFGHVRCTSRFGRPCKYHHRNSGRTVG
jgi:hypothetical protein